MNEIIFLGAGASKEAGVPISNEMTLDIFNLIKNDGRSQKSSAVLKFIIGGLLFLKGSKGDDPFSGISIEELLNTLDLLSERDSSELNPFIAAWHPLLNDIDLGDISDRDLDKLITSLFEPIRNAIPHSTSSNRLLTSNQFGNSFENALRINNNAFIKDQFQKVIRQAIGSKTTKHFISTKESITKKLIDLVWVREKSRIEYLIPLIRYARGNHSTFATLNYDNSIEFACMNIGVMVNTGLKDWYKTGKFNFDSNRLNLIKLHGSINWSLSNLKTDELHPLKYQEVSEISLTKESVAKLEPEIIFGGKNKLTAKGPFLGLLNAFREKLEEVNSALIIGYSFSDDHINEFFRNWINLNPQNMITVINPNYPISNNSFVNELNSLGRKRLRIIKQIASHGIITFLDKMDSLENKFDL